MAYEALNRHYEGLGKLRHIAAILHWDEAVIMPPSAGPQRAEAMATLSALIHERITDPAVEAWLAEAEAAADRGELNEWQSANVREIGRSRRRASCLPTQLVSACCLAQTKCEQAWRQMRPQNDWKGLRPLLEEVVRLARQKAAALSDALGCSPYDALMDGYEPGIRSESVEPLFEQLRGFLPPLTERVIEHQASRGLVIPVGPFPLEAQRRLGERLMRAVGFDANSGRLDVSHHPFCGGVPTDVRITTRYDEADFTSALMGVLHETGHAKYEQGLPRAWLLQPVGQARSLGMHEAQSLMQEMQVSRSREFLQFASPIIREEFAEQVEHQPAAYTVDNLLALYTRVQRGLIRVDADELTYPCHIIVRHEIERDLINSAMTVSDIPEAWDASMAALLGLPTGDDYRNGCMQDPHWPSGAFGYFPTYTLGAMNGAQLYAAAQRALPSIPTEIAEGRFETLNGWLRDNVWSKGSLLSTDDLMRSATGEVLDPTYFKRHLEERYLG